MSAKSDRPHRAADVEQWIIAARQGDQEALGQLLKMRRRYLLLIANEELDPAMQTKISPSDVVQDSMMEAGRHFTCFHGGSEKELLAWLSGILRKNVTDAHRYYESEKRSVAREVPLAELPQEKMPLDPSETPSSQALNREQDEQMEKALRQLPEHYRQILELRTVQGLPFAQIAEKLGSTTEAVRRLWARAAEKLAQQLGSPHEPSSPEP